MIHYLNDMLEHAQKELDESRFMPQIMDLGLFKVLVRFMSVHVRTGVLQDHHLVVGFSVRARARAKDAASSAPRRRARVHPREAPARSRARARPRAVASARAPRALPARARRLAAERDRGLPDAEDRFIDDDCERDRALEAKARDFKYDDAHRSKVAPSTESSRTTAGRPSERAGGEGRARARARAPRGDPRRRPARRERARAPRRGGARARVSWAFRWPEQLRHHARFLSFARRALWGAARARARARRRAGRATHFLSPTGTLLLEAAGCRRCTGMAARRSTFARRV